MVKPKILITRQDKYNQSLITNLTTQGWQCASVPMFATEPLLDNTLLENISDILASSQLVICITRNAAEEIVPYIAQPNHLTWSTIGPSTASYLSSRGISNIICPTRPPFDSNSLISSLLAVNFNFAQALVVIISGENGNPWLAEELQQRGAIVRNIETYRRVLPEDAAVRLRAAIEELEYFDIILITCVTSLLNLHSLAVELGLDFLNTPLLVVSERIRIIALEKGYTTVYNTESMSETDIISALTAWQKNFT